MASVSYREGNLSDLAVCRDLFMRGQPQSEELEELVQCNILIPLF